MFSLTIARKTYAQNLQYRSANLMRTAASIIIGYVYACIWLGVSDREALGEYGAAGMLSYIAFNQACLWTVFTTNSLGIDALVRTGQISVELMRPLHFFRYMASKEWGKIGYQFLFCSVPIYLVYWLLLHIRLPEHPLTWAYTLLALFLGAYISLCMSFMIGIVALWTTESRWLWQLNWSVNVLLSGFFIPIEWLPGWLKHMSQYSPYPSIHYIPTRLYMELSGPATILISLGWAIVLTLLCFGLTRVLRRHLEVQGG
ncbi:ABC-2 type transport system permease protein [Paenibacillus phyllosphaerae]|uniref:ABC-2 type transport system permease protein n=1 Tax=Paenibacillus phyllosphaerae TaxID=274593 RepID=A0A7W5FNH0_9BACL|nr:ABC-2 type transport system permease protein [Paenibacillus phyllosphaerae]